MLFNKCAKTNAALDQVDLILKGSLRIVQNGHGDYIVQEYTYSEFSYMARSLEWIDIKKENKIYEAHKFKTIKSAKAFIKKITENIEFRRLENLRIEVK